MKGREASGVEGLSSPVLATRPCCQVGGRPPPCTPAEPPRIDRCCSTALPECAACVLYAPPEGLSAHTHTHTHTHMRAHTHKHKHTHTNVVFAFLVELC